MSKERIAEELASWLPGELPKHRWFAGRSRTIRAVVLDDAAWLDEDEAPNKYLLALARVMYREGPADRYHLLLVVEDGTIREGMGDPEAVHALIVGIAEPRSFETWNGGKLTYGEVVPGQKARLTRSALAPEKLELQKGDASNSNVFVGKQHVFKLFRRAEEGESCELEVGRFLGTKTDFRDIALIRDSVVYYPPGKDESAAPTTIALLQDLIENEGDGWGWALDRLTKIISGNSTQESMVEDIITLGGVTGDLHAALASDSSDPAFAPEPATLAERTLWRGNFLATTERVISLIARCAQDWPERAQLAAQQVTKSRAAIESRAELPSIDAPNGFSRIRIHGDYHLGQTLKTKTGFVVIDFEGEPARTLAERRRKHSVLKDVAGMLRSFDYAFETARSNSKSQSPSSSTKGPPLREAFLEGYRARIEKHGAGWLIPRDPQVFTTWVDFFELNKALYEVEYEANSRPDWLHIPLEGVLAILERGTRR